MPPKTKYFSEDSSGYPAYTGPEEFRVLGVWVTGDVQLSPHTFLDMVDVIRGVNTGRVEAPQELSGNAFYIEADRDNVSV